MLLLVEDLHWLDSETQAWLTLFSDRVASARLLLVNYRPEFQHGWGSKTYYTQLRLDPLGPEEAHALLTALLGDSTALQPSRTSSWRKRRGIPSSWRKWSRPWWTKGAAPRASRRDAAGCAGDQQRPLYRLAAPTHGAGVLAARIDRLPADVALLQTLAVLGKEFAWSLLTQVTDQPEGNCSGYSPTCRPRSSLRATGLPGVGVHLQARPDAGSGLQRRAGAAPGRA